MDNSNNKSWKRKKKLYEESAPPAVGGYGGGGSVISISLSLSLQINVGRETSILSIGAIFIKGYSSSNNVSHLLCAPEETVWEKDDLGLATCYYYYYYYQHLI